MTNRKSIVRTVKSLGFSLVEVMVAMVIGMIGLIVMMQVFSAAEGQRRVTTGAGDAQSNGALAMNMLQRDIRQAGYGFNALNALGCGILLPAPASRTLTQLAPVVVNPPVADVPAGDSNTDTLLIILGSADGTPEGDVITTTPTAGGAFGVQTPSNFKVNHRVIAAPSSPTNGCSLSLATVTDVSVPPTITVPSSGATEGGSVFNLGASPKVFAYAVRAGNLTVCDYLAANCGAACTATDGTCSSSWVPIANNIVSLRAQYGRDTSTPMDGVDTWDQTTPVQPTPANQEAFACLWARASAVRIAVVARNAQADKDVVSGPNPPTWAGSAGVAITLGPTAPPEQQWQHYRYKVFETVVPIRNLPWMATCS